MHQLDYSLAFKTLRKILASNLLLLVLLLTTSCTSLVRPNFTQELVKLRAGQYQLDKTHSFLNFRIGHLELSKIVGRFNQFDATLDFDPQSPENLILNGTVQADSIDFNNEDLQNTLQEPDWFDTAQFPQLVFTSTNVSANGDNNFLINGTLTMRGITQDIVLNATFNGGADNILTRKYTIGFSANTALKRSDYGMDTFTAFVGDEIEIELHGEFQRQ